MIRNLLLLVFATSILSLAGKAQAPNPEKKKISLEEIWASPIFNPKYLNNLESMKDGEHYTKIDSEKGVQQIAKYSYKTGEKVGSIVNDSDLIANGKEKNIRIDSYTFSDDESKILISTDIENIYRHSTIENNYIYHIESKKLEALSLAGKQRLASFSPSGDKVAFVRENNLFYKDLQSGKEVQITTDGKQNKVINGATDWVYEEEFGFAKAFSWSPDGNKLAYYRFDESEVKEFTLPMYGDLYPELYTYKYPKAGEKNALVTTHIYYLNSNESKKITALSDYEYIPRIKWANTEKLCVFTMNRHQNHLQLFLADGINNPEKIYEEKSVTYIDINDDLTFVQDGKAFIYSSEKDGYNHLYYRNVGSGKETQITNGKWEISKFYGFDEKSKTLYFQAGITSPINREIYASSLKGKLKMISEKDGHNSAYFSQGFKYFINIHSTISQPYLITLNNSNGNLVRTLIDNKELAETLKTYEISDAEFFTLKTEDFTDLNYWIIRPLDFDPKKKYPVLMYVYGGPGSQTVENKWGSKNYLWYQHLASKGYIVVSVDNRGTGARGADFKKTTYKNLGKYEVQDQISAAKYFQKMPYVDATRIGIWGWSFGGYMTSLCMMKAADVFKTGIAVAPVTNWRFYDSIYTERFLQTPEENPEGYDLNSPINYAGNLEGNFLLVHGSADDNVHHQNAMELNAALVAANRTFDFMLYPNKNHGIYGGATRLHLFTKMSKFIFENL